MEYLYVCHFSNGHVKVGRSIHPKSRIAAHADRVACVGIELIEHQIFECVGHSAPAESALIERCTELATKRNKSEWFEGLDFLDVCDAAHDFASIEYLIKATSCKPMHTVAFSNWLDAEPKRTKKLAEHLGRTASAVSQWRTNGVPVDLMKSVRNFTNGEVTLEEMIPGSEQVPA